MTTTKTHTVNPGKGEESYFQSYHIIKFKYPVCNKKAQDK